jgi:hypothetical protein
MTWTELFCELSLAQEKALRAGDGVQVRTLAAALDVFGRQYLSATCPSHNADVPEAVVNTVRNACTPANFR